MSARDSARRTKASQHPDLFVPQTERSETTERNYREQEEIEDDFSPLIQDQQLHDTYGAGSVSDDPLQLEHVVVFGADSPSNLLCLPLNEYSIVKGYKLFLYSSYHSSSSSYHSYYYYFLFLIKFYQ